MAAAIKHNLAVHSELEQLFAAHYARVIRAAYRITGNMPDAEDAAQSVFLRIAQAGPESRDMQSPDSYVYRAAINAALDLLRKRQREKTSSLDDQPLINHFAGPEREYESGELKAWLRQALANLGPRAAEMFVLRYMEDYGNREIAQMLGTSQAAVAVVLHRTRTRLRKEFRAFTRGKRDDA